jgi:hypothetical protein
MFQATSLECVLDMFIALAGALVDTQPAGQVGLSLRAIPATIGGAISQVTVLRVSLRGRRAAQSYFAKSIDRC